MVVLRVGIERELESSKAENRLDCWTFSVEESTVEEEEEEEESLSELAVLKESSE